LKSVAAMKRELKALRNSERVQLTRWASVGLRVQDEVNTVRRLGYTVEVRFESETMILTAVKR
jgi:hypothetical protein